jgi:hypothetical protein
MAITRTATYTATYARTELIKLQVERALVRSVMAPKSVRAVLWGVDQGWISEISVYGVDHNDECHAELFIKIDWSRNALHIAAGRDTIQLDAGWQGGISTEIDLALGKFEMFTRELGLRKIFRVRYSPGVDRDTINQKLGFRPGTPIRWHGGAVGTVMSIPELDEVTVGINVSGQA